MAALRSACKLAVVAATLVLLCPASAAADPGLDALLARFKSEPGNAQLCEQIGVAYTRMEQFDQAAEFFQRAFRIDPRRVSAGKNLGTVLWFGGHKKESAAIFRSIEKRIPTDPVPALYLGLDACERRDFVAAAAFFEKAGPLASENPEVAPAVIETDLAVGRFEQAKRLAEQRAPLVSDPESASENYRWLAKAYDGLKLPEQAYRAFEQAIERAPNVEENYVALGVFAMDHANPAFARKVLGRGLGLLPNSAKLSMQMGLCWAMEGDFGNARGYFDHAAKADPRWSLPLLALGIADLQAGDSQSAGEAFRGARALDPGDYRCYYLHATAIGRSNPDPARREEMIRELKRAVELSPKQARVHTALGQAQLPSNPRDAEAQFREALRLDPSEPAALYQLSLLAKRAGNIAEAKRLSQAFEAARKKSKDEENELVLILKSSN